jgi:phage shock protein PspC (stress-responsive transcriptional regulator)
MTDQWNSSSGVHDAPTPDADSRGRNRGVGGDRWRRPRRSDGDRKIAGVAGGLGRALGVDPILFRVAFVVLTIFGGFGGLLYVLGWLLLPADGDEVSAAEALLGRGRSSVPPALAVGLGVVAVLSAFSILSWGQR